MTANLENYKTDIITATEFVREIEKGNLDVPIGVNESSSELTASLVSMRDQMKKFSEEERERSWVNEGMAKFVDILRSRKNENLSTLADNVIRNLVSYLQANQGGLFLLNDENKSDTFLELVACYAYDRKKFLQKRVEIGEGILGQVVLEKQSLYMTEVPTNFVRISSGLGEALPRNILIVPLKLEEQIYGVIEIAAFQYLKKYQIDFVERLGESIASTIAGVKGKDRTEALLSSTQQQAEEMRAQEEEMRQNMEELSATQEEMQRVMKEIEGKEAYVSNLLNVSKDMIFTIDHEYKLKTWNQAFAKSLEAFGMRMEKGMDTMAWYSGDEAKKQIELYQRVFAGEVVEFTTPSAINGETFYFLSINAPLRDKSGKIVEIAVFSKDVTAMTNAQMKSEQLLKEAQIQSEDLQRIMKEVEGKEVYTTNLLNVSTDSIYTIDREYKLMTWNKAFAKSLEGFGMRHEKGSNTLDWYQGDEKAKQIELYNKVWSGESVEFTSPAELNGKTYYFLSIYAPLRNEHGEVIEAAVFAKDITVMMTSQKHAEQLLKESQSQSEELKAQEEELRQNMEELSATQEEMHRVMKEVEAKEYYVSNLLNVSTDSIFTITRDYKLATWNHAFAKSLESFGMRMEKGLNTLDWYQPDQVDAQIKLYDRVFAGETFDFTAPTDINGETYYFLSTYAPLKNNQGEITEAAVFAKDVTAITRAHKHAEKLQQDLQAREQVLGVTTIMSEADLHGTITYVNDKLCDVAKYSREELIGKPHSIFRHPDMPKALFKKMWDALKRGETFKGIIKNRAKDGSHYWVDASIVPIKDEKGKIIKYIGARYHITNDKMAEELFRLQGIK